MHLDDKYYLYEATLTDATDRNTIIDREFQVALYIKPEDEGVKKTPYQVHRNSLKRSLIYLGLISPSLYGVTAGIANNNPLIFSIGLIKTKTTPSYSTYYLNIGKLLNSKDAKFPWLRDIPYQIDTIKPKNKYTVIEEAIINQYSRQDTLLNSNFWVEWERR